MPVIKSISVGNGDMFYIKHSSDNFSIIDCNLSENKENIVAELRIPVKQSTDSVLCRPL